MLPFGPILPDPQAIAFNSSLQKEPDEVCQPTVRVWRMAILVLQSSQS